MTKHKHQIVSAFRRACVLILALSLGGLPAAAAPAVVNGAFSDNFTSYPANSCLGDGATLGLWTVAFAGYGCVSSSSGSVQTSPAASTSVSQTHAGLILGPSFSQPSAYSVDIRTVAQLRQGSAPNTWEVGWFLWDYVDGNHFYYFQVKPNGWELGKEDPAYPGAQRFLATGPSPAVPVGTSYNLKVVQTSPNAVSVYVNGALVTSFTDTQSPYTSGRIGLYSEDATVRFENVSVAPTSAGSAAGGSATSTTPGTAPTVSALNPASAAAGSAAFNLAVDGSNFTSGSVVQWNGRPHPGTVQSATRIVAYVGPTDVASAGTAQVTVATPGQPTSNALAFTIAGADGTTSTTSPTPTTTSPATTTSAALPTVTALSPASAAAGSAAFNIAVDGSNFTSSSVVQWNGKPCPGTVQSATRIVAYVSPTDVASAGTAQVTVDTPGAAASNALPFTITGAGGTTSTTAPAPTTSPTTTTTAAAPTVSAISPSAVKAGSTAFNIAVDGANFTSASVVKWNGRPCPGTVQSATRIVAYVSPADVASAGTAQVTVATPGTSSSNPATFTILSKS